MLLRVLQLPRTLEEVVLDAVIPLVTVRQAQNAMVSHRASQVRAQQKHRTHRMANMPASVQRLRKSAPLKPSLSLTMAS